VHLSRGKDGGQRCGEKDRAVEKSFHGRLSLLRRLDAICGAKSCSCSAGRRLQGMGDKLAGRDWLHCEAWMALHCWM
jgi:hypothetical protein